ncbi:MAG: Crp/Fnr family transcriptional regulator, partial [Sphingobacteriia bacterium]|nr:Crp/Fnr family transcriptional regulator [Sphingobacteriia bacterium]
LINYCSKFTQLTDLSREALRLNFRTIRLKRKDFLLKEGMVCDFVAFLNAGVIRHYHLKNGSEITCDITLKNNFITDFKSLTQSTPTNYYFQILKDAELFVIKKDDLFRLYAENRNIESLGRIMAERVALRTIDIAMSLSADKPAERVENLIKQRSDLFQEVPQRYLANLLGISPESLSRIRARRETQ